LFVSVAWLVSPPVKAFGQVPSLPDTTLPPTTLPATTLPPTTLPTLPTSTTTTVPPTTTTTVPPTTTTDPTPTTTTEDPYLVVARESRDVQTLGGGLLVFVAFAFLMLKAGRRGVS